MTFAFLVDSVPFTRDVIAGQTSLGGSESACLGLARALQRRGHAVHVFTSQLAEDGAGVDHAGVTWHALDDFGPMNQFVEWDVVVSLRLFSIFARAPVHARLRLLWNQDLLVPGQMQAGVMGIAWALDHLVYVSDYHRRQWEGLEATLAPLGWASRNGLDLSQVPTGRTKDPSRIIHVSRPERGLGPLLDMWPALKQARPDATLQICRYSSMYDQGPGSWSDVCAQFDARVQRLNAEIGDITYLGELTKPQLYEAISDAAVMWYPGVSTFAETSCIAALEAQACGTPFVGSYRGALPETVPSGVLIRGDHASPEYQQASIDAVVGLLQGCASSSFDYRRRQRDGLAHVKAYSYDVIAGEWEQQIEAWFTERYEAHKIGVLRQLLHEDDHVAAKVVAEEMMGDGFDRPLDVIQHFDEAQRAATFCDYVISGKDQTSEQYGEQALADPMREATLSTRFKAVVPFFEHATHVLDVACGNGSFALALARAYPAIHVHGLDYSQSNIDRARKAAADAGYSDRLTFERCTVYDFDAQTLHADFEAFAHPYLHADVEALRPSRDLFDGLFVGEFIEHVANHQAVIDGLEGLLSEAATVVYTCPHGACAEMVPRGVPLRRGHVHRFHSDDLVAVFGQKAGFAVDYLSSGITQRGLPLGNWLIQYTKQEGRPAGPRPIAARVRRTRPLPTLSVGLIAKDAETDIGRCLASVWAIADQIVVGDTGSTDATKAIAASYGATVVDLPSVQDHPEGFAGVRNLVLQQCTGDWFLWIDCDEQLLNAHLLRRYLDGTLFNGFVIHQVHLYMDGPSTFDIPVRLFRHTGRVQFYGCVHEQPQDGDCNTDLFPTLEVADLQLAHTGYLTPDGREAKRVSRNLPLLMRDQQVFKDRTLGKVLAIREAVLQADLSRRGGPVTPYAAQGYRYAIQMFVDFFDDPAHKYHKLARPWYEAALRHLGLGWEQEVALLGRRGGLEGRRPKPDRLWVRDADEYRRLLTYKIQELSTGMEPVTFVTDPDMLKPKALEVDTCEAVPA